MALNYEALLNSPMAKLGLSKAPARKWGVSTVATVVINSETIFNNGVKFLLSEWLGANLWNTKTAELYPGVGHRAKVGTQSPHVRGQDDFVRKL
jgi:hypothetical protein